MLNNHEIIPIAALLLDLVLGEFQRFPHPVILIGKVISWAELLLNRQRFSPQKKRIFGTLVAILIPSITFAFTFALIKVSFLISELFGILFSIFLAYLTISIRGLKDAAFKVLAALENNDLTTARQALSLIVGRDTENLNESEIVRGTVETVAENSSDGGIAPLFYLIIGGVPLAMTYKAVNTLDSMLGYKSDRYLYFGWASAKLDDLFNLIPARITGLLMIFSAFLLRWKGRKSFVVMFRDARKHPSPNAGFPEAAVAGALDLTLGGTNSYEGNNESRPFMGDGIRVAESSDIKKVVRLTYIIALLMALCSLLLQRYF